MDTLPRVLPHPTCSVEGCVPHELLHLKGVVGELGVGSQGGVVTLGRNTETATKPARVSVPL